MADPPAALTALVAALHDEFDYECCFVKWPDGTSEHSTGAKYWPTRAARVLANLLALPASERDALAAALLSEEGLARALGSIGTCGHSSCPRDTSRHDEDAADILAVLREQPDGEPARP